MSSQTYRFKVGDLQCIAISDGTLTYSPPTFPPPPIFLFANAPREPLRQVLHRYNLHPDHWKEWVSPYICLVIKAGKHCVLIDTGANGLGPNTGKLLQNLKSEGIEPGDIDIVILTHGHPDHIGGNTDSEGKLFFADARYIMWKDEWDFWNSNKAAQRLDEHVRELLLGYARKNLLPIQRQLTLIDSETEILPCIKAIAAPGHTPGHMALAISSEEEQLLCVSDAVLHPIHLEQPKWHAAVDLDPDQITATRRRLLTQAVTDNALVLAFHFPFPGLGRVIPRAEGWEWQPYETTT
jgi:glyoxylase-like metal-dependent hydrolase (beta-lactamase superfamily II)